MPLVKICGVKTVEAALQAAASGADLIGMIFAPSKRQVEPELAKEITGAVKQWWGNPSPPTFDFVKNEPVQENWFDQWTSRMESVVSSNTNSSGKKRPLFVGVFVDQPSSEINLIASQVGLDLVQLHGNEPLEASAYINLPVIRAIHISESDSPEAIQSRIVPGHYAFVLFDTKAPGTGQQGGSGVTFDWQLAGLLRDKFPMIVAGGLTPENVANAIQETRAWAVDVSSGAETEGKKDNNKIDAFVKNVRT